MSNAAAAVISFVLAIVVMLPLLLAVRTNAKTMSDLERYKETGKWNKDDV